ncbi:MAG: saccharopine dehydrogenase NADP-binding domain-containing protein [Desulfobulbaceae bacterium]|nr:saccharopine dehydrogenase NADP-binding domain-containing protein [Desulfobulbaceae bacterium]
MKEKIGVVGGNGRVGRECLAYLAAAAQPTLAGGRHRPDHFTLAPFRNLDVYDSKSLTDFCRDCRVVVNCAGPASQIRERVALAALAQGCHYVDPGGYTPLFSLLAAHSERIREAGVTFLLTLGVLPGLSELLPVYVAGKEFDQVEHFVCAAVGRDFWTYASARDIAWGVGNIGNGESPVYYEKGLRKMAGLLTSASKIHLPPPVGRHTVFRLMRDDLQEFVAASGIQSAHAYGNNWGCWTTLATVLARALRLYGSEKRLDWAARLIMKAAAIDMGGKKPGFMLHLHMRGRCGGAARELTRFLFFEETYRATGICAAIGAQLAAQGMRPGVFRAAQFPNPCLFMEYFQAAGYSLPGGDCSPQTAMAAARP